MKTLSRISHVLAVAGVTVVTACSGGGSPTPQSKQTVGQQACAIVTTPGWRTEITTNTLPYHIKWCPQVLSRPNLNRGGAGVLETDVYKTGYRVGGWVGRAEVWSTRLGAGRPDSLQDREDFAMFRLGAQDDATQTKYRGTYVLTYEAGIKSTLQGQQETDSVEVGYWSNKIYPGDPGYISSDRVFASVLSPVVVSNLPGSITGSWSIGASVPGVWNDFTEWDTSGYQFQWKLDGVPLAGQNGNQLAYTFPNIGTYTLSVDETLGDGVVVTTRGQVSVLFLAGMDGPSAVGPNTPAQYTVSAPGGAQPYSYAWTLDDSPIGAAGSSIDIFPGEPGTGHSIGVTVTDANGRVALGQRQVFVTANDSGCLQEPCGGASFNRTPKVPVLQGAAPRAGVPRSSSTGPRKVRL